MNTVAYRTLEQLVEKLDFEVCAKRVGENQVRVQLRLLSCAYEGTGSDIGDALANALQIAIMEHTACPPALVPGARFMTWDRDGRAVWNAPTPHVRDLLAGRGCTYGAWTTDDGDSVFGWIERTGQ